MAIHFPYNNIMNLLSKEHETHKNLMRAFAGESQARNRYTFASEIAKQQKMYILEKLFLYTANQEKAHAKVFWDFLKNSKEELVFIDASYPVDLENDLLSQLEKAHLHEYNEFDDVYPSFANTAEKEGFPAIAYAFREISKVEQQHGDLFQYYYNHLKENTLFSGKVAESFVCLNCGHVHSNSDAPKNCPVCNAEQGYFIRNQQGLPLWI